VDEAAKGRPFIISKNGKPIAKETAVDAPIAGEVAVSGS